MKRILSFLLSLNQMLSAIIIVVFCSNPHYSTGQPTNLKPAVKISKPDTLTTSNGECGAPYFMGLYEPKSVSSLSELPDSIRARTSLYLIERLGPNFYKNMVFSNGQIVDLPQLYSAYPDARNYKWQVGTYYICFECRTLNTKSGFYLAGMTLDDRDNVITQINLPTIAATPAKAQIISIQEAADVCRHNWHGNKKWLTPNNLSLKYNSELNSLTWVFSNSREEKPGISHFSSIIINANDGAVVRKRNYTRRYIPF